MLKQTPVGPLYELSRPLCSHLTAQGLQALPHRLRLLALYKRLYRLRLCFDNQYKQNDYLNLVRRKFKHGDVELRRRVFLQQQQPMSDTAMAARLANTYAFVFNATCSPRDAVEKVHFYDDLKAAQAPRTERSIVDTMLELERQMPPQLKHDHRYQWVQRTAEFYDAAAQPGLTTKQHNALAKRKEALYVGYLHYETALMAMNETHALCL